jgi:hypothetical protein
LEAQKKREKIKKNNKTIKKTKKRQKEKGGKQSHFDFLYIIKTVMDSNMEELYKKLGESAGSWGRVWGPPSCKEIDLW